MKEVAGAFGFGPDTPRLFDGHFRRLRIKYRPASSQKDPAAEVQRTITGFGSIPQNCKIEGEFKTVLDFWEKSMSPPANPFSPQSLELRAKTELKL